MGDQRAAYGQPEPDAAWMSVITAAVVTQNRAEQALDALEVNRARYDERHEMVARKVADWAPDLGRPDLYLRSQLILADISVRRGQVLSGASKVQQILTDAQRVGDMFLVARSHLLLCEIHHSMGDSPSARINGIRSIELLPDDAPLGIRIDHLRSLGTAYGPGPDSARCHRQALDLTAVIGDAARAIGIHNSYAYFAYELGNYEVCRDATLAMMELSEVRNIPLVASQLDTVARMYMMTGRHQDAIEVLRPLFPRAGDTTRAGGIPDTDHKPYGLAECVLTLADAHLALGRFVTAQQALHHARYLADERHLGRFRARVYRSQAQLYAAIGEWQQAYEWHRAFHNLMRDMFSKTQESHSRAVQASYDAGEQQRDVEEFRELAMRDALTGLYNRRFLDEALAARLETARRQRQPLSVAIADADVFKRINDDYSHEVGDEVLRRLAVLIAGSVADNDVVGRLGGEEFLIVLPNMSSARALQRCEQIRAAVEAYDFSPLTGSRRVTISIGMTTSPDGADSASVLMAAADRNLYAAKRSGRNRVMGDSMTMPSTISSITPRVLQ